jgi:hypothetical protein
MPYRLESHGSDKAMRCAVCEGKFGLVRHYSWRTPLCSRKCVDRFKARHQSDHNDGPSDCGSAQALADDYERRAEKASLDDAKHCSIRS